VIKKINDERARKATGKKLENGSNLAFKLMAICGLVLATFALNSVILAWESLAIQANERGCEMTNRLTSGLMIEGDPAASSEASA
jgi:hypothetical protein